MPSIQVRDCPVNIYEQLKTYAIKQHRSISQQVLAFIEQGLHEESSRPNSQRYPMRYEELSQEEIERKQRLLQELAQRPIWTPPANMPSIVDMVREDRDNR